MRSKYDDDGPIGCGALAAIIAVVILLVGMGMAINHQRRRVDALTVRVEAIEKERR